MSNLFRRFVREEEGQDLVEYSMLLALIAVICVGGVTAVGVNLSAFWNGPVAGLFPAA